MKRLMATVLAVTAFAALAADRQVAIFVTNKTKVPGMQEETAAIKERLAAAFSEVPGFQVVDSTLAAESYEKSPNVAALAGCDYVVLASVVGASSMRRTIGDKPATVFTLRMTMRVTDANGKGVDGMPMWSRQLPVLEAADEPITYYQMLIDQWAEEATRTLAVKSLTWRPPTASAALVPFVVSTTIDIVTEKLESQTKGVKGEQLQELRKVVGGASVELDGVLVGTAPCEIRTTPGLHKLRVTREWMKPYEANVSVVAGQRVEIALEMTSEGVAKWGTVEALRSAVAKGYADAAMTRGIKVNVDTANWRDVGTSGVIKVEK